jgi:hypothetical protein
MGVHFAFQHALQRFCKHVFEDVLNVLHGLNLIVFDKLFDLILGHDSWFFTLSHYHPLPIVIIVGLAKSTIYFTLPMLM